MNNDSICNHATESAQPLPGLSIAVFGAEVGSCTNSDPGPDPTYDEDPIPEDELHW